MLIFPAIDLRDGRCVRLEQGDYARETVFSDDPVEVAGQWVQQGAQILHLVDLDGAKLGSPVNTATIEAIVTSVPVPCQVGGGLRTESHLEALFGLGVQRAVIGTRAFEDPGWLERMARTYPGQLVLGIDARDGQVATEGWLKVSTRSAVSLAQACAAFPLAGLVYTDIARDGMLAGPNVVAMAEMVQASPLPVIASGGVTTVDQVATLKQQGLAGCIIGRALYEGRLRLAEALAVSSA